MKSNTKEIKQLIDKFNDAHNEFGYAEYMTHCNDDLSKQEKEEWKCEMDGLEYELHNIAGKIKSLNPSKYMMRNYSDLGFIISNYV